MNLLLDTHALLWVVEDSPRLGRHAASAILDGRNQIWISAVSAWEIAIKHSLGKLPMDEPPERILPREIERNGFATVPVSFAHGLALARLPLHHRDPFDRLLIAQAVAENLVLVSAVKLVSWPVP